MIASAYPTRPRLPTVFSIYQPIERYWSSCGPVQAFGPEPDPVFNRLDACLIYLVLDMLPHGSVLIDLSVEATGAAGSVLGLIHPRVQAVVAGSGVETAASVQAFHALKEYHSRYCPAANLEVRPISEFLAGAALPPRAVILADARMLKPDDLAEALCRWCDSSTDVLVLLLGLGSVGACPALEAVLRVCPAQGLRRFWLARDLEGALSASGLGVIAPRDHPAATDVMFRIQQLYTTNYHFLDLLRASNQAALESARLDAEVMKTHPSTWALHGELKEARQRTEEVNRHLQASRAEEAGLRVALESAAAEITRTRGEVLQIAEMLDTVLKSVAFRVARRLSLLRACLAPETSRRYRIYRQSIRALRTWRDQGLGQRLRRAVRRCWPRGG